MLAAGWDERSSSGSGFGTVIQELAYLMRAGEPDAMDRMVGLAFGALAVQLLGSQRTCPDGRAQRRQLQPRRRSTRSNRARRSSTSRGSTIPPLYRAKLMRVEGMPMFLY